MPPAETLNLWSYDWNQEHTNGWKNVAERHLLEDCSRHTTDYFFYSDTQIAALEQSILGRIFQIDDEGARKAKIYNNPFFAYEKLQRKHAKKIRITMQKVSESAAVSMQAVTLIYRPDEMISAKNPEAFCVITVFRVSKPDGAVNFVDHDCRVYKTWKNYLNENKVGKGMLCYTRNGFLRGETQVDFGEPPSCTALSKAGSVTASTFSIVPLIACTALKVGSIVTLGPAATLALSCAVGAAMGTATVYSVARQGLNIYDRCKHGQGISSEIFQLVTTISFAVITQGVDRFSKNVVKADRTLTRLEKIVVSFAVAGMKSMAIVNFLQLLYNCATKTSLSALDILNFAISCHQFYGVVMSPWTAQGYLDKAKADLAASEEGKLSDEQSEKQETDPKTVVPQENSKPADNIETQPVANSTFREKVKAFKEDVEEVGAAVTSIAEVGTVICLKAEPAYNWIRTEISNHRQANSAANHASEVSPDPQQASNAANHDPEVLPDPQPAPDIINQAETPNQGQANQAAILVSDGDNVDNIDRDLDNNEITMLRNELNELLDRRGVMDDNDPEKRNVDAQLKEKDKELANKIILQNLMNYADKEDVSPGAYEELKKFMDMELARTTTGELLSATSDRYVQTLVDLDVPSVFEKISETQTNIRFANGESTELLINDELVIHPKSLKLLDEETGNGEHLMTFMFTETKNFHEQDPTSLGYDQKKREYIEKMREKLAPLKFMTQTEKSEFTTSQLEAVIINLPQTQKDQMLKLTAGEMVHLKSALEKMKNLCPTFTKADEAEVLKIALGLEVLGEDRKIDGYLLANKLEFLKFKMTKELNDWQSMYMNNNPVPRSTEDLRVWNENFTNAKDAFFRGLLQKYSTKDMREKLKNLYSEQMPNKSTSETTPATNVFRNQNGVLLMDIEVQSGLHLVEGNLRAVQESQNNITTWESPSGYFGVTKDKTG